MVEHNLAKVRVASSSLVSRSGWIPNGGTSLSGFFFEQLQRSPCPGGGIGRHAGLKILWPVMAVRVQVPPGVLNQREKQSESKVLTSDFLFSFCSLPLGGKTFHHQVGFTWVNGKPVLDQGK